MAVKNFSIFVSLDSVGEQAEYIRTGLKYELLQKNVNTLLSDTNNTTLTFINTFNALSIPKFKEFLTYILELRTQYSKDSQGIKYIPIYDPYHTHPDYEIHPRQRIWFDIPLLRYPDWLSISILTDDFIIYMENAVEFMKQHTDTTNFVGFYDFEIEKAERNLAFLKEQVQNTEKLTLDRRNFTKYLNQYDERRGLQFHTTFPEFEFFYNQYNY